MKTGQVIVVGGGLIAGVGLIWGAAKARAAEGSESDAEFGVALYNQYGQQVATGGRYRRSAAALAPGYTEGEMGYPVIKITNTSSKMIGGVATPTPATLNVQLLQQGDVNGDGQVNIIDGNVIERIILGLGDPNGQPYPADIIKRADVNLDGAVNIGDTVKEERLIMGVDPQLIPALSNVANSKKAIAFAAGESRYLAGSLTGPPGYTGPAITDTWPILNFTVPVGLAKGVFACQLLTGEATPVKIVNSGIQAVFNVTSATINYGGSLAFV